MYMYMYMYMYMSMSMRMYMYMYMPHLPSGCWRTPPRDLICGHKLDVPTYCIR